VNGLSDPIRFELPLADAVEGQVPACGWMDHDSQAWSMDGSSTVDTDAASSSGDGSRVVVCECDHLTDFAVLMHQARLEEEPTVIINEDGTTTIVPNPDAGGDSLYGSPSYLVFAALYVVVALWGGVQFARIIYWSKCANYLQAIEHGLIMVVGLVRASVCLIYYLLQYASVADAIDLEALSLISSVPYLFMFFLFTFLIFAWAGIYHAAQKRGAKDPFQQIQKYFWALNIALVACTLTLFCSFAFADDLATREKISKAGSLFMAGSAFGLAAFFLLYGMLLVRKLTSDFPSRHAKKIFKVALGFAVAFSLQSGVNVVSVAAPDVFIEKFDLWNSAYFGLELVGLCIVMFLFKSSVKSSIEKAKESRSSRPSTGSSRSKLSQASRSRSKSSGKYSSKRGQRAKRQSAAMRALKQDKQAEQVCVCMYVCIYVCIRDL
jgi:hypothetical protein